MAEENNITTVFSADISNFTKSTQELNRYISTVNAEFKNATAGMGDWSKSADGLQAKLKQLNGTLAAQKKQLETTEAAYAALKAEGKENTAEAQKLYIKLQNQQAQVKNTQAAIDDYTKSLNDLDKTTEKTEKSTSNFTSTIGGAAKGAVLGIGAAVAGTVTAFLALAESTREVRTQMGQLQAAYETAGLTAEQATQTHLELTGVLGDSGKATEAAQQIAQLASNEKELADLTNIATGVFATWGESLPTEALFEAINHSSELGTVQGNLADALEWSGVTVEDFNAELAKCNTEQERQELITSTLNGLYGEAADKYKEVNGDVIAANEAQQNLTNTMAELGAIAEPIMTMLKNLLAELLTGFTPFIQLIGEGLTGALNGSADGAAKLSEGISGLLQNLVERAMTLIPTLGELVVTLVPQLASSILSQLPQLVGVAAQLVVTLINGIALMLPNLISTVVSTVVLIVNTLLDNLDLIIDAGINLILSLGDGLISALPKLIAKIPIIISNLIQAIVNNLPKIIRAGINLLLSLQQGIMDALPQLVGQLPVIIASVVKGLLQLLPELISCGGELLEGLFKGMLNPKVIWNNIKNIGGSIVDGFKKVFKINSPSKVFEELGEYSGEGYFDGFADTLKGAKNALDAGKYKIAGGMVSGANGGTVNNSRSSTVNVYQTFNKMPTTRYALHQAKIEAVNALKLAEVRA